MLIKQLLKPTSSQQRSKYLLCESSLTIPIKIYITFRILTYIPVTLRKNATSNLVILNPQGSSSLLVLIFFIAYE